MSSKPRRQTLAPRSRIHPDSLIAAFIEASGLSGRVSEKWLSSYRYPTRHLQA